MPASRHGLRRVAGLANGTTRLVAERQACAGEGVGRLGDVLAGKVGDPYGRGIDS